MNKKELLIYEAPWYTEFVSWSWLQDIVAKRLADKVNKKYERYEHRKIREGIFNPKTN